MASIYHSPGTGPKVDWQARYEAMRSVARRYLDLNDEARSLYLAGSEYFAATRERNEAEAELRRALDELEADRG